VRTQSSYTCRLRVRNRNRNRSMSIKTQYSPFKNQKCFSNYLELFRHTSRLERRTCPLSHSNAAHYVSNHSLVARTTACRNSPEKKTQRNATHTHTRAHTHTHTTIVIVIVIVILDEQRDGYGIPPWLTHRGAPRKKESDRRITSRNSPESRLQEGVLSVNQEGKPRAMASSFGYRVSISTIVAQSLACRMALPTL